MSGISGVYYLDGRPAGHATPEMMLTSISHRGGDGRGIWCQGAVGLAQCIRYSSRESRRERLPKLSQQTELVLVADARIDNRQALIKKFAMLDRPAEDIGDGQLILKAYQTWGESCPEKLEGDFAFVIWDAQQQCVFCARDAAGVKPLYYFYSPQLFAFASEIKALLVLPEIPRRLNERKVADYLLWSFEDTRDTFYQDIHRLPPASTLTVGVGEKRVRQYWSLDPKREINLKSDAAYIQSFQEIFSEAVRCRLNGVDHLGSTLSGGLDSSSIACTASQQLAQSNKLPVKVFSAVFPAANEGRWAGIDERSFINDVIAMGGFEAHFVDASQINPLINSDQLNHVLDEPYFAPTLFIFWALLQSAQQAGVEVLLDGTDGDSTISSGEAYLTDLARSGRWITFYRQAAALARVQRNTTCLRPLVWQYGIRPLIPTPLIDIKRRLVGDQISGHSNLQIIRPEFAQRQGYPDFPREEVVRNPQPRVKSSRQKHWQEMSSGVNAYSLELFDKAAGAFSLEMSFPFYDRRLMEFCLALPGEQKLSSGWTRYILRAGMKAILPENVRWRTSKSNLFQAFNLQFQQVGKEGLNHYLAKSGRVLGEYVACNRLRSIYDEYWSRPTEHLAGAYTIYGAITLATWMEFAGFV